MPDINCSESEPEPLEAKMERLAELIDPAPGRVAILVKNKEQFTAAGLYIPVETARSIHEERATSGYVIATGDGAGDFVQPGDFIVFGKYSGTQIRYYRTRQDFDTIIVMSESSILGKMKEPEDHSKLKVRG